MSEQQPTPQAPGEVQATGRPNARLRQTAWDMVRSMAVVLALVIVVVAVAWRPQPDPVRVVDPAPVIALAVAQADFPVGTPTSLPPGWRATSARWEPTATSQGLPVLHLGYMTPSDQYAKVSQSTAQGRPYLVEQTGDAIDVGTKDIGGVAWQAWEGDTDRALVRTEDGVVTVVAGSAPWEELGILAASLVRS